MKSLTGRDIHALFAPGQTNARRRPIFLLGAGASMPNLPTAKRMKIEIVRSLAERASAAEGIADIESTLGAPHMTLEVLCSIIRYRSGINSKGRPRFDPARLWKSVDERSAVNSTACCLAALAKEELIGGIVTSNFDTFLPRALSCKGVNYQVITQRDLDREGFRIAAGQLPIVAFHGTVHRLNSMDLGEAPHSPPTSALARGLATPFRPNMRECLEEMLCTGRPVIVVGYSGNDHYDMNPLIERWLAKYTRLSWHWWSHNGEEESFSKRVRRDFKGQFEHANTGTLLRHFFDRQNEQDKKSESSDHDWPERIRHTMASFDMPASCCRDILKDIKHNLGAAWVVLEHYYLYSTVYDENVALTFGGVPQGNRTKVEHLRVFNTDWHALLQAQAVYREEDEALKDDEADRAKCKYQKTVGLLNSMLKAIDECLENHPDLRHVDHAILLVGKAFAEDYLGLVNNKRRMAIDSLLTHSCCQDWIDERDRERRLAINHFGACVDYSEKARAALEKDGDSPDGGLDQLVQHRIWRMIGRENIARALTPPQSLKVFRECINERWQNINLPSISGAAEYQMAHLPQIWLRASEMMKDLLHISGEIDLPRAHRSLSRAEKGDFEFALDSAKKAYKEYEVVGEINLRFPAYFETLLLSHAAKGEYSEARNIMAKCLQTLRKADASIRNKRKTWVNRIRQRLNRILANAVPAADWRQD